MKKIISILICMLLLLPTVLLETTAAATSYPSSKWTDFAREVVPDADGVYRVSTAEGLAWISLKSQSEESFSGMTVLLTADIDLSDHLWVPIGNAAFAFAGTFDGQNHTVRNMKLTDSSSAGAYVGFIGYIDGGSVLNIKLAGAMAYLTKAARLGGIAGCTTAAVNVSNCSVEGTFEYASGGTGSEFYIGGIVGYGGGVSGSNSDMNLKISGNVVSKTGGIIGYSEAGEILNCVSCGTITVLSNSGETGGICGISYKGKITGCSGLENITAEYTKEGSYGYTGGVCGYADGAELTGSVSSCTVNAKYAADASYGYTGGICGYSYKESKLNECSTNSTINVVSSGDNCYTGGIHGYSGQNVILRQCFASGGLNITYTGADSCYVGGIGGRNYDGGVIDNCSATGDITVNGSGNIYAGGIVRYNGTGSVIRNTFAICKISSPTTRGGGIAYNNIGTVENCYAAVSYTSEAGNALSYYNSGNFTNVYYNSTLAGGNAAFYSDTGATTGIAGMTTAQMRSAVLADKLNSGGTGAAAKYWECDTSNGGYPYLLVPSVSGIRFTAPMYTGGKIMAQLVGSNLDNATELKINGESVDLKSYSISFVIDESKWKYSGSTYSYNYSYKVTLDGETVLSGTEPLSIEFDTSTPPSVRNISYNQTTFNPHGGKVNIFFEGTNLYYAVSTKSLRVTATTADGTTTVSGCAMIRNDDVVVMIAFPMNIGDEDMVYTLRTYVGNVQQQTGTKTITVEALNE